MKIIVKETTEKEVEITLPYYTKSLCFMHKVISEDSMIQVLHSDNQNGIELKDIGIPYALSEMYQPCTEQDFNEKFNEVLNLINQSK